MGMDKKALVAKYRGLLALACGVRNLPSRLSTQKKGTGNQVRIRCALLRGCHIHIRGNNNRVIVEDFSQLKNVSIHIGGSNNTIHISKWCTLTDVTICIEDSGNTISLGEHTRILGNTELAAIEGTSIRIGAECLFSSGIHFRTGDSHSVVDLQGKRINPSRDIVIGNHVWIGTQVTCLKGARVADNCIIGACALVTGTFPEGNCALAGVPAKVVRRDVNWDIRRLPMEDSTKS